MLSRFPFAFFAISLHLLAANDSAPTGSKPVGPLTQAADEFKILTRDAGLRADSPPGDQQHQGPKMLWHGRLYENFRNDILDAIPHEIKQNGGLNAVLHRNQFGFNVSGPLVIPHLLPNNNTTFFSISYEGVRESISRASLHTIPTTLERTGDFSKTVDQAGNILPIYDPSTTSLNPNYNPNLPVSTSNLQYLRTPFPGNRIPGDRLVPLSIEQLRLYPQPNAAVGPFFQNNFFVNSPETDLADGVITNVDRSFGDRHRVTWNSTVSTGLLGAAKYFDNIANPGSPDQSFNTRRGSLGYIFTASSQTVNTLTLHAASTTSRSGVPGQSPFPLYELGNYLSMGTSFPASRNAHNHYQITDGFSTHQGKHSLSLTAEADLFQVNSYVAAFPSGFFQFGSGLTSLPGIVDTGYGFSSFLLGLPQYAENTIITAPSNFRDSYQSLAAVDKYQFTPDLTLTVSLTLSRRTPRTEKYNRQSTIDPSVVDPSNGRPGALVFAGLNGIPAGLGPVNYDLDPSFSLAWNPLGDSKSVVRASFARTHGRVSLINGQFATQGFNARQAFTSPNIQLTPSLPFASGFPPLAAPLPTLSPSFADNSIADFLDISGREPLYQSAGLSFERELPFSLVVTVGANYSGGRDLLVGDGSANPNAISPNFLSYGNALYDQAFRVTLQPFPQFNGFELFSLYPEGRYQRDSVYLNVEKRASFGLSLTAHYSFSKQLDDYSAPYGEQDFFNTHNDWSPTFYNPPQFLQLGYVYELPFGSNKPLLSYSDWRRPLVDGWTVSGNAYWNGGTPLAFHPEYNNTGNLLSTLNVDTVSGVDPHTANPGPSQWYNPAAFAQPPDFTLGTSSPTSSALLGPSTEAIDLSVNKRLPIGVDRAFELSASAFNVINHGNWNYPDTGIGPVSAPNVNAGHIIGSHGGRVIQLGLKFSF